MTLQLSPLSALCLSQCCPAVLLVEILKENAAQLLLELREEQEAQFGVKVETPSGPDARSRTSAWSWQTRLSLIQLADVPMQLLAKLTPQQTRDILCTWSTTAPLLVELASASLLAAVLTVFLQPWRKESLQPAKLP